MVTKMKVARVRICCKCAVTVSRGLGLVGSFCPSQSREAQAQRTAGTSQQPFVLVGKMTPGCQKSTDVPVTNEACRVRLLTIFETSGSHKGPERIKCEWHGVLGQLCIAFEGRLAFCRAEPIERRVALAPGSCVG